jgi:phage terminase Nu1 subunit (DNA packaging protein)
VSSKKSRPAKSEQSAKPRIDLEGDRLITRRELSRLSGYDMKTLRVKDMQRTGCRYLKLGTKKQSRIVYRLSDAQRWLASMATEFAGGDRE